MKNEGEVEDAGEDKMPCCDLTGDYADSTNRSAAVTADDGGL